MLFTLLILLFTLGGGELKSLICVQSPAQIPSKTLILFLLALTCPGQNQSAGLTSFRLDRLRNKETSSRLWGFRSFTAKRWSPWKNKHPKRGGPSHWATLQGEHSIRHKRETPLAGSAGHRGGHRRGPSLLLLPPVSLAMLHHVWSSETPFSAWNSLYRYCWSLSLPAKPSSNHTAATKPSYIPLPLINFSCPQASIALCEHLTYCIFK